MFLISICMVALKILMLIFLNHPKRAIGKFMPSISHNYSTVDPSCAVITKILEWLYVRPRGFSEISGVRGVISRAILRIPIFFRLQLEVAIELVNGIKMFLISMVG